MGNLSRDGGHQQKRERLWLSPHCLGSEEPSDDKQGELRRYVWVNQRPKRTVIQKREVWRSRMTWNIVEFEAGL
jgi:hypothetical protein